MLQHISISIFQVLQCTSFLSKLLTLVESGTITTMKYIYSNLFLILESIEHYVSLVNNYLRYNTGFTHVRNICISKSSAFEVLCLNPHILQTALSALNNLRGDKIDIKFFSECGCSSIKYFNLRFLFSNYFMMKLIFFHNSRFFNEKSLVYNFI